MFCSEFIFVIIALLNVCTSSIGNMTVLMNDSMFFFFFCKIPSILITQPHYGKQALKGFWPLKCDVGNFIFSKSWEFFENSLRILFLDVKVRWLFTLLKSANNKKVFEYGRNWFVCQSFRFFQDFGVMHKEGSKKFKSLKVGEGSSSHLKFL